MAKKKRTHYTQEQKQGVIDHYNKCRTREDRENLAKRLGIPNVYRLYNLANRLGVAGGKDAEETQPPASQEKLREIPETTKFTETEIGYLKREFGRRQIEDIAFHLLHSETAVFYQARKLGLRKPVKHWRAEKVASWFGITDDEFAKLQEEGIDFYPLAGRFGELEVTLVSTTSIARWMESKKNMDRLKKWGADEFFILEIKESVEVILEKKDRWERCSYLSHGHVCMNPKSQSSYGFYCTNNEGYRAGDDPQCQVKILKLEDLRPEE